MSSVQHPNIIHIYEVFENKEKMVLVMEIAAGGELYDFLSERKCLEENEARRIFRQISTAVYYCHKHNICHRDLKLENILLDENGCAKVSFETITYLQFKMIFLIFQSLWIDHSNHDTISFLTDCRFRIVECVRREESVKYFLW